MRNTVKREIGKTVKDMLEDGLKYSFTKREINALGIEIKEVLITPIEIKKIRKKTHLSQTVFAELLNVSPSSVRQWEQGKRVPTGATKVLLELLDQSPHLLDYRIAV